MISKQQKLMLLLPYLLFLAAICALTVYSDLLVNSFVSNEVAVGHLNIYKWASSVPVLHGYPTENLPVMLLPLYYMINGLYIWIVNLIFGNIESQIHYALSVNVLPEGIKTFFYIFLLKGTNLIAFFSSIYFLKRICHKIGQDPWPVCVLWLSSAILIAGAFMEAHMDIIPTFFTLVALYCVAEEKYYLAMVFLAVAAGSKNYGLLFAPPIALIVTENNIKKTIKLGLTCALTYILIIAPFVSHDFMVRVFEFKDNAAFTHYLKHVEIFHHRIRTPFFYIYAGLLAYLFFSKPKKDKFISVCWSCTFIVSLVLTTWWFPNWLSWFMPFIIFLALRQRHGVSLLLAFQAIVILRNVVQFPGLDAMLLYLLNHGNFSLYLPDYTMLSGIPLLIKLSFLVSAASCLIIILGRSFKWMGQSKTDALTVNRPILFAIYCMFPIILYVVLITLQPFL